MTSTSSSTQSSVTSNQSNTESPLVLNVDFTWRKLKCLIYDASDPESKPLYIVDFKKLKPSMSFKKADTEETFATAKAHVISINSKGEIRGNPFELKAEKRFKTQYTHLSHALAKDGKPTRVHWHSNADFKDWNFTCSDDQGLPVAKYGAHCWAIRKVAHLEFTGPRASLSEALIEEMVVTGVLLCYTMYLRINNIGNLVGAFIAKPGHVEKNEAKNTSSTDTREGFAETDAKQSIGVPNAEPVETK